MGRNETSVAVPQPAFPQYNNLMPNDQRAKLLAMHRESAANAGMYVAVVLFVYVILLSLLLCRYVKRRGTRDSVCSCDPQCILSLFSQIFSPQTSSHPAISSQSSEDSNNKDEDPHRKVSLSAARSSIAEECV